MDVENLSNKSAVETQSPGHWVREAKKPVKAGWALVERVLK
jgi:hypothetical protein